MIYTMANTFNIGKPLKRVVDANGLEYNYTLYIDTDTGRIEKQVRDKDGHVVIEDGAVKTEVVMAAPPVVVEFVR